MFELNPCSDIKYNETTPDTLYMTLAELDLVMRTARERGRMYVVGPYACVRHT